MMEAELKEKWVAALRSGDYKQTKVELRDGNKHCALGVLCEVGGLPLDERGWSLDGREVYAWLDQQFGGSDDVVRVYSRNDEGMPFPELADWIEENL
jgi:hypothetical protein